MGKLKGIILITEPSVKTIQRGKYFVRHTQSFYGRCARSNAEKCIKMNVPESDISELIKEQAHVERTGFELWVLKLDL